ncbi:class I adenylate cyclase [Methylobacter marinus]|uniref:class I adenylate cyclase n=1 Tax=Methylobacter marinus TaxID=34058 RepID=UPI0003A19029|nr:class I adenylate cyclase [Methylobacter marinus]
MTEHYQLPPIRLGSPGEDISVRDLQAIKQRFKKLHQYRRQCVQNFLQPRQRLFLDLLPLIFHHNYPLLPGFISSETPAGIPDYSPSSQTIKAAKQFSKNFKSMRRMLHSYPIEGLFLMGSAGSIAFSKTSDMDIWLCHQAGLLAYELDELQKKAAAVETWAASLGLEVHFFLIDSQQFRLGHDTPLSTESSGKTQHYLLLEEFYRTAIYIAGKSLAWWLVPPHEENNYTQYVKHLKEGRFIYDHDFIDLGGLEAVPAEEFISATLWHIYKSIHAPHKSLLKLLLMECYASEYPQPEWLCQTIKKIIYQGNFVTADLDPYLLIYRKVEAYLQQAGSTGRLALARQCFYLKIMGLSDNTLDAQSRAFKEHYIQDIAIAWHWPTSTIADLKQQKYWDIRKATQEHAIILRQLTHCFRMIMGFAREHVKQNYEVGNDLKLIGRKLYSFLRKKTGKIEIITTRTAIHAKEQELSIVETPGFGWSLFLKKVQISEAADFDPLISCRSLLEVCCWLVVNRLYHKQLQLHFSSTSLQFPRGELHAILSHLDQFLTPHFNRENSLDTYRHLKTLLNSLIVLNLGLSMPDSREAGLHLMSDRSDPLSYGHDRQCFVQTLDSVSISNWNEITTCRYEGMEGLLDCLTRIINKHRKPLSPDDLTLICHTPIRAHSIMQRIKSVFNTLITLFPGQDNSTRYLLSGGATFYVFQCSNNFLGYRSLATKDLLFKELARPQAQFGHLVFDQGILEDTPIPLIYTLNKAQTIQLFYAHSLTQIMVYIVDEKGALYRQTHNRSDPNQLLNQYAAFLEAVLNHNALKPLLSIEYYEIQKNSAGVLSCSPLQLKAPSAGKQLTVRISGEIADNGLAYTIYCNKQAFSSRTYGNQLFQAVHEHILQFRRDQLDYPVYITDIDLPLSAFHLVSPDQLQTIHYLNYKQSIEAKLNARATLP